MENDYFCDACGYSQPEPGNCPHCKVTLKAPEDAGHVNGEDLDDELFKDRDLVGKTTVDKIGDEGIEDEY